MYVCPMLCYDNRTDAGDNVLTYGEEADLIEGVVSYGRHARQACTTTHLLMHTHTFINLFG